MEKVEKVDYYFINKNTMAIMPNKDIIYGSIIYETDRKILCKQYPLNILDSSCLQRGATFDGRKKATEFVTRRKVMLPIPIEPSNGVIFIPTKKVKDPECAWLSYCHIKKVEKSKNNEENCDIIFCNEQRVELHITWTKMQKQIMLAGHIFGHFLKDQYIS